MGCFKKPCVKVRGKSLNMYPHHWPGNGNTTTAFLALTGEEGEDSRSHKHDKSNVYNITSGS